MLRNIILVFSLFTLMVEGDLDFNDGGIQAMSTDKDSTSDEAPTESMRAISSDQPDTSSSSSEMLDAVNQVTAPEPALHSVEDEDEDETSDSEEGGKKKFGTRSAKPLSPAQPQQPQPHLHHSPALPPISSAHISSSPAVSPQPIIPQPKALVRSRMSKKRSRTNRRQI